MSAARAGELARFVEAQAPVYAAALAEIEAGEKRSHWMWFVFPQLAGLGRSDTARFYALRSIDEARDYWAHPLLGRRLAEATRAAVDSGADAGTLFGYPDDLKFRSCMTLFAQTVPEVHVFTAALERLCGGRADPATLELLAASASPI